MDSTDNGKGGKRRRICKLKALLCRNKLINRYFTDERFKSLVLLYSSYVFNLVYAVWQIICGIYYISYWFITLGCYYVLLSLIRVILIRGTRKNITEGVRYRICGIMLLLMNAILTGIVVLVVNDSHGAKPYAGYLVYVMALYTFVKMTTTIINMVKYRKNTDRAVTSAKSISFVSAIISMLSLAIVMIIQFGGGTEFLATMTISLGSAAAVIITITAIKVIITAK